MTTIKTTRECAGYYKVTDGNRTVSVIKVHLDDGDWWIATPDWSQSRSTDPLYTKRDAVENARYMLEEAA